MAATFGQQQPGDEVIRITTELVQTGVVVLDKQGRFVDGLRQEQFVLKVDGRQVTPAFFERVIAGTPREELLERSRTAASAAANEIPTSYRGRTIIFFLDDLHLSAESVLKARQGILDFVEQEMTLEDQVAVVSPSGQLGFLQRFSDLKPVVRAAVNRLTYRPYTVRDHEQVPMTEYQALRIEQGDSTALHYFVTKLLEATNYRVPGGLGPGGARRTGGISSAAARQIVKDRASLLLRQTESVTGATMTSLESLMRSLSHVAGRKVLFLISDGFFLNDRATSYNQRIARIADAAVRSGLVIYSLDARGLVSMIDASSNRADPQGLLARANIGELAASQEGISALAVETGGKAFFNGSLQTVVNEGLAETSNYYLLAWRPPAEGHNRPDFKRVEVSIPDRPDLTVRVPRGFFLTEPNAESKETKTNQSVAANADAGDSSAKKRENAILSALASPSARIGLTTKLSTSFIEVPGTGPVLTAATQIATDLLGYGSDGKLPAAIDLAGVVLNEQGKQAGSFKTRINIEKSSSASRIRNPAVVYNQRVPLKPGLYQVRVAARDDKSGRVGSAAQWIEIPDLSAGQLTLATLLLGGQMVGSSNDQASNVQTEQVQFSVDRRFSRESQMTFLTIVYNALATGGASPKLESQIEVLRGGKRVIASPRRPIVIEPNTDLTRIPYGGAVALKSLTPGRYVLRVSVNDLTANRNAVSEILFEVE
jgi:VWFA-related protein